MSDSNPFEWSNAINAGKDPIRTAENPERAEKDYNGYFTNRSLSYHVDAIMYANEMNTHHTLPNQLQVDYLINTIRPRKRFAKWAKPAKSEDLNTVMEYYGVNHARAHGILKLLSAAQLAELKKRTEKGGRNGDSRRVSGGDS
jgi:hypothetical protein